MRKTVYLVGGKGYIGSSLGRFLSQLGDWAPEYLDLKDGFDARKEKPPADNNLVIWLASPHELEPVELEPAWDSYYQDTMIYAPKRWVAAGHPMIYISSMRAMTSTKFIYGRVKEAAEKYLLGPDVTIVRPGTVWGPPQSPDSPIRVHTAMNYALVSGKFTGDGWKSYTCYLPVLLNILRKEVGSRGLGSSLGRAVNAIDSWMQPMTATKIRSLLAGECDANSTYVRQFEQSRQIIAERGIRLSNDYDSMAAVAQRFELPYEGKSWMDGNEYE